MAKPLLTSELDRCARIAAGIAARVPAQYQAETFKRILRELLDNEYDDDLEIAP